MYSELSVKWKWSKNWLKILQYINYAWHFHSRYRPIKYNKSWFMHRGNSGLVSWRIVYWPRQWSVRYTSFGLYFHCAIKLILSELYLSNTSIGSVNYTSVANINVINKGKRVLAKQVQSLKSSWSIWSLHSYWLNYLMVFVYTSLRKTCFIISKRENTYQSQQLHE